MATHCSVLAWRISGTGESMGWHRVRQDGSDLAAAAAAHLLQGGGRLMGGEEVVKRGRAGEVEKGAEER